jgi:hypothetical protein
MKESSERNKFRTINSTVIIFLILALIIIILLLLGESNIIISPLFGNQNMHPIGKNFSIIDSCSIIAGKLIHPIDNEDQCRTKCFADCEIKSLDFKIVEFEKNETSCNKCICQCK